MIRLKQILHGLGVTQAEFGRAMALSGTAVAEWLNHDRRPKRIEPGRVEQWLRDHGASATETAGWSKDADSVTKPQPAGPAGTTPENAIMLLRAQRLSAEERQHFNLFADPFRNEIHGHDDLYLTQGMRHVREAMWQAALHGGFLAVVGESGSGKSMLRRDLIERVEREGERITVIEPYVLGMEDNDKQGKTLKAADISGAIIGALDPLGKPRRDTQARFRQVHELLQASHRAGAKHLLIVEEAHSLPVPTLKHLKRFLELEHGGFTRLLGIVLLGQSELGHRLSETDPNVREVVQRCEVLRIHPLDGRLQEYLRHKFRRQGAEMDAILAPDAVQAVQECLTVVPRGRRNAHPVSLVYPLAVGNLVTGAMRKAARIGMPVVTGDLVREVLRDV